MSEHLIFEKTRQGRCAVSLPDVDIREEEIKKFIPVSFLRKKILGLPEVTEPALVRHFTKLSQKNMSVDTNFYPLGSCTMKYNPKVNEALTNLPDFCGLHPYQPSSMIQGILHILYDTCRMLEEISGMDKVSLQPAAGAHGELASMLMLRAYFEEKGEIRDKVLIPDSAHGTNPASSSLAGFKAVKIKSNKEGEIDLDHLHHIMDEKVSCIMLTLPNTLGFFEKKILDITEIIHAKGGLVYLDGANLNALMGITRPGDFGVDIMHFNLHKTFATPHGGGGPGSGPVGVKKFLEPYLPVPLVEKKEDGYCLDCQRPKSIGKVRSFYGNLRVVLKAYCYLRILGKEGIKKVSEDAIISANYIRKKLQDHYPSPYKRICMHECVLSAKDKKEKGIRALDIAKRLLDFGIHPPTMYFPLIVEEALMIEPTETESKETLDAFISALLQIAKEIEEDPTLVKEAPHTTCVLRINEVEANRFPKVRG
ncbi:aminomethyl-transferring glycine dehydrogenase subunit GcvPB [Candidatus Aerophobetes bacterium]|nr:aminomethyl-transferring glycine dehydrogenase subunit GcvPB [Candidatus Aerophobetes bacterium]